MPQKVSALTFKQIRRMPAFNPNEKTKKKHDNARTTKLNRKPAITTTNQRGITTSVVRH